jgi:hypothetical protein
MAMGNELELALPQVALGQRLEVVVDGGHAEIQRRSQAIAAPRSRR